MIALHADLSFLLAILVMLLLNYFIQVLVQAKNAKRIKEIHSMFRYLIALNGKGSVSYAKGQMDQAADDFLKQIFHQMKGG